MSSPISRDISVCDRNLESRRINHLSLFLSLFNPLIISSFFPVQTFDFITAERKLRGAVKTNGCFSLHDREVQKKPRHIGTHINYLVLDIVIIIGKWYIDLSESWSLSLSLFFFLNFIRAIISSTSTLLSMGGVVERGTRYLLIGRPQLPLPRVIVIDTWTRLHKAVQCTRLRMNAVS